MLPGNEKGVYSILGTGVTNAATVTANIDTLGFSYASIDLIRGTSNTATNNCSVLKLTESDDTVVTNFAAITEFTGDGVGGFTIANESTSDANITRFNVDLKGRKRYLKLTASPVTTQAMVMVARLSRAAELPDTATEAGVTQLVQG